MRCSLHWCGVDQLISTFSVVCDDHIRERAIRVADILATSALQSPCHIRDPAKLCNPYVLDDFLLARQPVCESSTAALETADEERTIHLLIPWLKLAVCLEITDKALPPANCPIAFHEAYQLSDFRTLSREGLHCMVDNLCSRANFHGPCRSSSSRTTLASIKDYSRDASSPQRPSTGQSRQATADNGHRSVARRLRPRCPSLLGSLCLRAVPAPSHIRVCLSPLPHFA
mmetsp:Transcript_3608/g.6859  ORF Transcript_3608/g.6859 Transcript_3608/m.6859 type:complete len:229 (+) Transcript_3608:131-817(+)